MLGIGGAGGTCDNYSGGGGGGGGGASFAEPSATNVTLQTGTRAGNGRITIAY